MADYRIVCARQEPANAPPTHAHIVQVGVVSYKTGPVATYEQLLTVNQVVKAIQAGNNFWTWSPSTGKHARVEPVLCRSCNSYTTLRSAPDAIADNNLDNLSHCV